MAVVMLWQIISWKSYWRSVEGHITYVLIFFFMKHQNIFALHCKLMLPVSINYMTRKKINHNFIRKSRLLVFKWYIIIFYQDYQCIHLFYLFAENWWAWKFEYLRMSSFNWSYPSGNHKKSAQVTTYQRRSLPQLHRRRDLTSCDLLSISGTLRHLWCTMLF